MPIKPSYGLLKARPIAMIKGTGSKPHYQIRVVDNADHWRIAVNVRSQDGSEVMYVVNPRFEHPIRDLLRGQPRGFQKLEPVPGGMALDFIRGNIADPRTFVPLPMNLPGPDNDLNEKIDHYVQRAVADEEALIHAFGAPWGPEQQPDNYFGFRPGRGIHEIHMNQGNPPGRFFDANGPWQDGGLIFHFPARDEWVAFFTKFQTQAFHTDDRTGNPLDLGGDPGDTGTPGQIDPNEPPTGAKPDGLIRIVAAFVNDTASPERETVTLVNTSDRAIALAGWSLKDKNKNAMPLSGSMVPGEALRVDAKKPFELSNRGGIISLIDDRGVKIDGVSYTREQASRPGWTIVF